MADTTEPRLTCDDFLGGRLRIWQPETGYRAATDPVLLAAACPAREGETVLDLGCGVGVAALCVAQRTRATVTGLELQADYAALARRNAEENGLPMEVITGDLADMPPELKARNFDHVILNPPYFGPGAQAPDYGRAVARQERTALGVWIDSALRRLTPTGQITIIHLVERLTDVIVALENRAAAVKIKPLAPRLGRPATRFLLTARKGSRTPSMLANPLILHEGADHATAGNRFTAEADVVLRKGEKLNF